MSSKQSEPKAAVPMTVHFHPPRQYDEPLDVCLGDPRVLVGAIHELCAALRVSGESSFADGLYALARDITAEYGKLEWDAPVPEPLQHAAFVQACALVPAAKLRKLSGPKLVGLMATAVAGEA
ncbi:hypothetical protein [Myxococcus sp. CA040A]|uniref:hypothetical protein n=1 Tax=Myxococcus sp. CA040A TaxID=2741738 RepID=UPI00157B8CF7|nr:hypothetical protein [Myxococcus sp. CA040A]NTX08975.1 hypothetical protein [Myxococcus sp. CA040A]